MFVFRIGMWLGLGGFFGGVVGRGVLYLFFLICFLGNFFLERGFENYV